jgi:hypothetical protein
MNFEVVVPFLFPVFFIAMWAFVLFLLALLGGWSHLAQYYQTQTTFNGQIWRFRSGRLGWVGYNGCLTLGANDEGLYLAVFPFFRIGHPPLFIPWYDITIAETKGFLSSYLEFNFTRVPSVRLRIPRTLGDVIVRQRDGFS